MNYKHVIVGCVAILIAHSMLAQAESVDLRVTGTLIPGACTPTLSGEGVIDYGYITADKLSLDSYTALDVKSLAFTIICSAPAKVAIKAINGRPGTVAGATEVGPSHAASSPVVLFDGLIQAVVGLGLSGSTPIGGYSVRAVPDSFKADGNDVVNIWQNSDNDPDNWDLTASNVSLYTLNAVARYISWAESGVGLPLAFTVLNGQLEVQAYINKLEDLDVNGAIQLDGQSTIEIVYL